MQSSGSFKHLMREGTGEWFRKVLRTQLYIYDDITVTSRIQLRLTEMRIGNIVNNYTIILDHTWATLKLVVYSYSSLLLLSYNILAEVYSEPCHAIDSPPDKASCCRAGTSTVTSTEMSDTESSFKKQ